MANLLQISSAYGAGRMKQRGVEEQCVALCERQLYAVRFEISAEVVAPPCKVARRVTLRTRQQLGRSAFDRHVAVRERALQGEKWRHPVHMSRIARGFGSALKAEVIVAMRLLRGTAGPHHVDLRGHLPVRAEPRVGGRRDEPVRVVTHEGRGLAQTQLFQRIPDAVVGAGLREVIAARAAARTFIGDDRLEARSGGVDRRGIFICMLQHQHAGAVAQHCAPLRQQGRFCQRVVERAPQGAAIVKRNAVHHCPRKFHTLRSLGRGNLGGEIVGRAAVCGKPFW